MTDDNHPKDGRSIVRKDLDDADRTDGFAADHYGRDGVATLCDAEEGQDHE